VIYSSSLIEEKKIKKAVRSVNGCDEVEMMMMMMMMMRKTPMLR